MEDTTDNDSDFSANEKNVPTLAKMKIRDDDEIIIVTVKLPIQLYKHEGQWKKLECKSIIINTLFNLQRNNGQLSKTIWMGHPGVFPKSESERQEIEKILREHNCIPIFINQTTFSESCQFHETVIRPLFHNFKSINSFEYDSDKK